MFLSIAGRICLNILKDKKQVQAETVKKQEKGMATEEFKDGAEVNQDDTAAMQKVGGWNPALKLKAVSTPLSSWKREKLLE